MLNARRCEILAVSITTMLGAIFHILSKVYMDQEYQLSIMSGVFWFLSGISVLIFIVA
jgi:hypothetical protein